MFLGVDTSNYVTSLSLSDGDRIVKSVRLPLTVEMGERGLRQSDAVFQHTVNLPRAFEELGPFAPTAVGVSATPRDCEGSYMPCFLAGVAAATAIASSHGVPLYRFSHQRGHIAAGLYAVGKEDLHLARFIAFHVSGGTTEITLVDHGSVTLLGGTKDISAGKAVDRIGVKLGLSFPCGSTLERLASENTEKVILGKSAVNGLSCNLSGLENQAEKAMLEGRSRAYVADLVLEQIAVVLERLSLGVKEIYPDLPILYVGGVMSNKKIRRRLEDRFHGYFAEPQLSSDNAAGIARLTALTHVRTT